MTRSTRRRAARLGALLTTAAGTLLACAAAAEAESPPVGPAPAPAAVAAVPGATLGTTRLSAPDGLVWTLQVNPDRGNGLELRRYTPEGERDWSRIDFPGLDGHATAVDSRSALTPLADGDVAVVTSRWHGSLVHHTNEVLLMRIGPDGTVRTAASLPQPSRRASAFAIEPDGGLWWARSCRDELYHRAADGAVRIVRLPRSSCGGDQRREGAARLQLAADGALWLVNLCQRRIVRVAVEGRVTQWRPRNNVCLDRGYFDDYPTPLTLTADASGGIAYASGRVGDSERVGGRVSLRDGLVEQPPAAAAPLPDGRSVLAEVDGRDGGRWSIGAVVHTDYTGKVPYDTYDRPLVRFTSRDGAEQLWPLDGVVDSAAPSAQLSGPDGALWAQFGSQVLRFAPSGLAPQREPSVRALRLVARSGRSVWVALACDADPERWCTGSVRLGGAAGPVRFVIAGQSGAAVRLTLGDRAARKLRRGRAVPVTALVAPDGAAATATALTLR